MAILPVLRVRRQLRLDATCLVVGSMAPDFSYFVRGVQRGTFSHTWPGLFAWGIPATLVIALVFHALVKWPLVLVAPRAASRHLVSAAAGRWPARWNLATLASCVASALVGAGTHLAWDGFTHRDGFGARLLGADVTQLSLPLVGPTYLFRVLQYASSLVGLVVVTIAAVRATRRLPLGPDVAPDRHARATFAIALASGLAASAWRAEALHPRDFDELLVIAIAGMLAAVIVASVVVQPAARRLHAAASRARSP